MVFLSDLIKVAISKPRNEAASTNVSDSAITSILEFLDEEITAPTANETWHYLSTDLLSRTCSIRLRVLDIIDVLFNRYDRFRELVAENSNINIIARSAGLIKTLDSSRIPLEESKQLEEKVKGLIELWDYQYGVEFPHIHSLKKYLTETRHLKMPNIVVFKFNSIAYRSCSCAIHPYHLIFRYTRKRRKS